MANQCEHGNDNVGACAHASVVIDHDGAQDKPEQGDILDVDVVLDKVWVEGDACEFRSQACGVVNDHKVNRAMQTDDDEHVPIAGWLDQSDISCRRPGASCAPCYQGCAGAFTGDSIVRVLQRLDGRVVRALAVLQRRLCALHYLLGVLPWIYARLHPAANSISHTKRLIAHYEVCVFAALCHFGRMRLHGGRSQHMRRIYRGGNCAGGGGGSGRRYRCKRICAAGCRADWSACTRNALASTDSDLFGVSRWPLLAKQPAERLARNRGTL